MKIFVIVLKVLMMIATGVIAVVLNILGLISLITTETTDVSSIMGILIFWMSFTVICYILPVFFAMLKKYFICGALTFVGLICVLILHEMLPGDPGYLYMPLLIITVLGILLAIFGNWIRYTEISKSVKRKRTRRPPLFWAALPLRLTKWFQKKPLRKGLKQRNKRFAKG